MKCEKCGAELVNGVCPVCGAESLKKSADFNKEELAEKTTEGGAQKPEQEVGSDFDKQYSMMFEKPSDSAPQYQVDQELKRKREARYDESFANMSDSEKIKALEAARLARKEKREKKEQKKANGGVFASIKSRESDKTKKTEPRKRPSEDLQKPESSKAEPRASRSQRSKTKKKSGFAMSPKAGLAVGCVVAAAVIAVIIGAVNMASKSGYELPETPTVYAKGDSLYAAYDGKKVEISADFIAEEYVETTPEPSATPSRNRDDDEPTPAPEPYYEPVKEKDLITYTEDGTGIFFMDNANLNENKGSLNFSKSGEKKSTVKIADDVYYNIAAAKDGSGVMYLTGTDKYGGGGTLYYWSALTNTSTMLSENVLPGDYIIGQNGNSLLYLTEYNSEYYVGDLYLVKLNKGAVGESKKVDSDVYKAFGTNPSGEAVVYAKNYNDENMCFETYLMKANSDEKVMVTDGSRCEPVFLANSDGMYAGGSYADYYQTLYFVSLQSGEKEKLSGNLTEIVKMSKDEQAVIFRKANAEGTAFDYYYANQAQSEGQIIAENITVLDDEDHKRVSQFEINDDFTRAVYIQGYDVANESGGLYTVAINNGAVGSDRKISDTAYSCNITPDGLTIRYADSYDITWNLVTLNAYSGEKNTVLATEVGAGAFTFDKAGEYIVFAKNYSLETRTGDVYAVNNKGKVKDITQGVSSYGLKSDGDIVYYNSQGGNSSFELFKVRADGKKTKSIDKDVSRVVTY